MDKPRENRFAVWNWPWWAWCMIAIVAMFALEAAVLRLGEFIFLSVYDLAAAVVEANAQ